SIQTICVPRFYALSSCSGRILTEKENVCVGISFPRINKNGAEKIFNAIDFLCLCGIVQCVSDAA
ncbi:hypothetical protein ACUOFC_16950, partial [Escherichia sp. TWPC-MK]